MSEPSDEARPPLVINRAFREQLLALLPLLPARKVDPAQVLDIRGDLGGVLDLETDAFLEPLETFANRE